ncbi:hypothetical protein IQ07DRAFT_183182 [Pyrenochaeta sp. DS3sAY3a]|nr:hypothetical protein IQ07DRAFT_183182 [Pyrenochaeta sp. DS3sAY3a]
MRRTVLYNGTGLIAHPRVASIEAVATVRHPSDSALAALLAALLCNLDRQCRATGTAASFINARMGCSTVEVLKRTAWCFPQRA